MAFDSQAIDREAERLGRRQHRKGTPKYLTHYFSCSIHHTKWALGPRSVRRIPSRVGYPPEIGMVQRNLREAGEISIL
jgi:hypothetical protein